ncbi:MAG: YkgJ family cysteine cluster protein [Candidatus Thiodiazotropha sp.]
MIEVDKGALDFFRTMHHRFADRIQNHDGSEAMLADLLTLAFTSYEGNAELHSRGMAEPACQKGCATCCSIRVVATAPEVLLIARYLHANESALKGRGVHFRKRLAEADEVTHGLAEAARVRLRRRCPFIQKGACVIYAARPLACRSHLSYDKQACVDAAAGRIDEIPHSPPHLHVRSLIQNALQAALRDAHYPWAIYEINHALKLALENPRAEQAWLAGDDVFKPARVKEVSIGEMAKTFDQLLGRVH